MAFLYPELNLCGKAGIDEVRYQMIQECLTETFTQILKMMYDGDWEKGVSEFERKFSGKFEELDKLVKENGTFLGYLTWIEFDFTYMLNSARTIMLNGAQKNEKLGPILEKIQSLENLQKVVSKIENLEGVKDIYSERRSVPITYDFLCKDKIDWSL